MRIRDARRGVRVRIKEVLDEDVAVGLEVGQLGTILDNENAFPFVQFDNFTKGHSNGDPTVPKSVQTMTLRQLDRADMEPRPKAPKKPKAPKARKPVWATKFLDIHPKSTKADLVKLLQDSVDHINSLGIQLVLAQNTLARRKKAAK